MNGMSDHKRYRRGERILRAFSGRARKGRHGPGGCADRRVAKGESASSLAGGKRSRDRRPERRGWEGVGRGGSLVIFTLPYGNAVSSAGTIVRYGCL